MLHLLEDELLGKGRTRECYRHPENVYLCIKVDRRKGDRRSKLRREGRAKREIEELKRLANREMRLIVPGYHGSVPTQFGVGHIFDYITNNGETAPSLLRFLRQNPNMKSSVLSQLKTDLIDSGAIVSDLHGENILIISHPGVDLQFALIDGFSEGTFIKKGRYIKYFARKRLLKKWRQIEKQFSEEI